MSLVDTYKDRNKNEKWFKSHASLGRGATGRMFEYTNTNFRTQKAFADAFAIFLEVENMPRDQWPRQGHGQEKHKHYVINMIQSKLFRKDVDDLYSKTAKGQLYSQFIKSNLNDAERWLVNYLFLLNGYYTNRKNYIVYRVKEDLLGFLLSVDGMTEELLVESAKNLLGSESLTAALRSQFFYTHSFYDDSDFLIGYLRSSEEEKEELARYIESNLSSKTFRCCISKKYQPKGNFSYSMLLDETKVFLLTLLLVRSKDPNVANLPEVFVGNYNNSVDSVDRGRVMTYLQENKRVFDPIFVEILELEEMEIAMADVAGTEDLPMEVDGHDVAEDYIDETSEEGKQRIKAVYNLRKRQARVQSGYTCALETMNNCRPVYFTARANGKNYLELHHLIPREFRNDFSYSIEVLANYVTLCPRCHRQIHLAVDRERKHLINALYEDRKDRLKVVGLDAELKDMYTYYGVDS